MLARRDQEGTQAITAADSDPPSADQLLAMMPYAARPGIELHDLSCTRNHYLPMPVAAGRQASSARAASRSSEARSLSAVVALARGRRLESVSPVQS